MSPSHAPGRQVGHVPDVLAALGTSRTTLYRLMREDSDFPLPVQVAGRLTFFMDEVEAYKARLPRRQYAAGVAAE